MGDLHFLGQNKNKSLKGEPKMALPYNKSKKTDKENFRVSLEIAATQFDPCPETCEDLVNTYGTYNIQPTADNENDFPAIAQGTPPFMLERDLSFHRDGDDFNPASDHSNKHCL